MNYVVSAELMREIEERRALLRSVSPGERERLIDERGREIFWAGVAHVRQLMKERREKDKGLN